MPYILPRKVTLISAIATAVLGVSVLWYSQKYAPWQQLDIFVSRTKEFVCIPHQYTAEIVSVDPLLIYINNFTSSSENTALIQAGEPNLQTSEVYLHGQRRPSSERTSKSAGLPSSNAAVQCILTRSRSFLGTLLRPTDDFGTPQLVRYETGERFDLHHDWYDSPQRLRDGSGRNFNRIASFFVFLEDTCKGGETWFPFVEQVEGRGWRPYEKGGTVFTPKSGSALFWVNLFKNGTGDGRVVHAGLPLEGGRKTAMNIWPRRFF